MAATDSINKGKHQFKFTTPKGQTTIIMADSEFEARQKIAHRMTKHDSSISYGTAWAVVSPSSGKVKVEKIK